MSKSVVWAVESLESRLCLSAGDLKSSFGNAGLVTLPDTGSAVGLAVQPDGDILVASTTGVSRFTATGARDDSFGTPGAGYHVAAGITIKSFALQLDGKMLLAGETADQQWAVVRLLPDGSPDTAFGVTGDGVVRVPLASPPPPATDAYGPNPLYAAWVFAEPDGGVLVVGNGDYVTTQGQRDSGGLRALRLDSTGALETSYAGGGQFLRSTDAQPWGFGVILDATQLPDGTVRAVGYVEYYTGQSGVLYSFDALGNPVTPPLPIGANRYHFISPDPGGGAPTVVASGAYPYGSLDAYSIATPGNPTPLRDNLAPGEYRRLAAFLVAPDHRYIAAGSVSRSSDPGTRMLVQRFNADGSFDPTFGSAGTTVVGDPGGGSDSITRLALTSDGDVVAAGTFNDHTTLAEFEGGAHALPGRPPRATASPADPITNDYESRYLTVRYAADQPIDLSTFDGSEILVVGPHGYRHHPRMLQVESESYDTATGTPATPGDVTVRYILDSPNGAWAKYNGRLRIYLVANKVRDVAGRAATATLLGRLRVSVPVKRSPTPTTRSRRAAVLAQRTAQWFASGRTSAGNR